jgi:hypothetical protein
LSVHDFKAQKNIHDVIALNGESPAIDDAGNRLKMNLIISKKAMVIVIGFTSID